MTTNLVRGNAFLSPDRPAVRLLSFKPVRKNTLRGFASVEFPNGLQVFDIVVGESNGETWAMLPTKPILDPEGRHVRDEASGKPKYAPFLAWNDPALRKRFSKAVAEAVRLAHPDAFGEAP